MTKHLHDGQGKDDARPADHARYKYQRLRERLRRAVTEGELSGKLPGERELARRYDANAKTINKALCDLTTEGLLVRHVGRGTFVADGAAIPVGHKRKLLTFGWVSPFDGRCGEGSMIYTCAEQLIRERGHRIEPLVAPAADGSEIPENAISPGQLRSWDGVILAGRASDRLLADLHRRHFPTVMINNHHDHIKVSAVLMDYAQGAFEVTQHLVQMGHLKIAVAVADPLFPAARAAEMGFRVAMQRYGLSAGAAIAALDGDGWNSFLSVSDHATAAICVGSDAARILAKAVRQSGPRARLPMSVAALAEPGMPLNDSAISAYEVSADHVARWAVELLSTASPGQAPRTVIVPGIFADRGSTFPPNALPGEHLRRPKDAVL